MPANAESIHTEIPSGQVLHAVLTSLWRRKWLVLAIGITAVALGLFVLRERPALYTAEAHIRGEFAATNTVPKEEETVSTGAASLDPIRVIETQSLLLQSHQVARRVVQDLGIERLRPVVSGGGWLSALLYGDAGAPGDALDVAAIRLLRGLSVTSDPRAYLITVRYSAGDPELAAEIANTFVAELLRSIKLQQLVQQRSAALAVLTKQLGKFGDKHPSVAEAKMRVEAEDERLRAGLGETGQAILRSAGDNVTPAIATLSRPKPAFVIGLLLFGGLVFGAGAALFLERDRWWRAVSQYYAHPFGAGSLAAPALAPATRSGKAARRSPREAPLRSS
ncbi:MAG: Wzz/FepE/Etk N-terminal domain-containing protein [Methyloceanibacter sp.]